MWKNMSRSKQDKALDYFVPLLPDNAKNTKYVCQINNCGSTLEARNRFNLVSHIKTQHDEIFKIISTRQIDGNAASLKIRRLKLIQNLTKIVTVDGRPFAHLSDSGTIGLMSTDLMILQKEGHATGIHSPDYPAVKVHINYLAARIINEIKNEVRGKFVSLLADIGTKSDWNALTNDITYRRISKK